MRPSNQEKLNDATKFLTYISNQVTKLQRYVNDPVEARENILEDDEGDEDDEDVPNLAEEKSEQTDIEAAIKKCFEDDTKVIKTAKIHYMRCDKGVRELERWVYDLYETVEKSIGKDTKVCMNVPERWTKLERRYNDYKKSMHYHQSFLLSILHDIQT